jgi:HprK-related kinase A
MSLSVTELPAQELMRRLTSELGLPIEMGPYCASIRTRIPQVIASFQTLYGDHRIVNPNDFVDFRVEIRRPPGFAGLLGRKAAFVLDGHSPFNVVPGDQGFPLLEWGLNYCVYSQCHQHLTLHAAVLERHGKALILPAPSGSGKSTLCAGLLFNGWRLLSDELTLICPKEGNIIPIPRPVSLKNESIPVMRRFAPQAEFGSEVNETVKGIVAHFKAPRESVRLAQQRAMPGWVVLPKYLAGSKAKLTRLERARAFMHLVANAFNYDTFGRQGFDLLGSIVSRSDCFSFEYSNLQEAVELFSRLADTPSPSA